MTDVLDTLYPQPRRIAAGGETIDVLPLKVRQIPAFSRAIAPSLQALAANNWVGALALHGEALIEACAAATGRSSEWLGELDPDEFLALVTAVLEVNGDFFVRRLLPAIEQAAASLTRILGAMPSPGSAQAGTA